jgi:hypothetical protein
MTTTEVITFLRHFNRWRRGDDSIPQPQPGMASKAIDAACDHIERLEQEIYGWRNKWECAVELAALAEFELSKKTNKMTDTPETDNLARGNHVVPTEFAQDLERKLRRARDTVHRLRKQRAIARNFGAQMERERDESLYDATQETLKVSALKSQWITVRQERDEARDLSAALQLKCNMMQAALDDWDNAVKHVEADHADEVHCGCVPVLRKLLTEARVAFAIATDRCVEAQSNERAARAKSDRAEKMLRTAAAKADQYRKAIQDIAALDTSQDASPQQCAAVLLAMNALDQ